MTFILQLLKLQVSTEFILAVSYPITTNSALQIPVRACNPVIASSPEERITKTLVGVYFNILGQYTNITQ